MGSQRETLLAQQLRRNATEVEKQLWRRLRSGQLEGFVFRRQHPVFNYIADFACISARLVVELDGGQHADSTHDQERDAGMRRGGWRILRFWNNEVIENMEGVLLRILEELKSPSGSA